MSDNKVADLVKSILLESESRSVALEILITTARAEKWLYDQIMDHALEKLCAKVLWDREKNLEDAARRKWTREINQSLGSKSERKAQAGKALSELRQMAEDATAYRKFAGIFLVSGVALLQATRADLQADIEFHAAQERGLALNRGWKERILADLPEGKTVGDWFTDDALTELQISPELNTAGSTA